MKTTRRFNGFALAMAAMVALVCAAAPLRAFADEQQTVPLLMIVVEYDGGADGEPVPYDSDIDWGDAVFGSDNSPTSYYSSMSEGTFTFAPAHETSAADKDGNHNAPDRENDGVVHITLAEAHGAWGLVNEDSELSQEFGKMVLRAFEASRAYVDYAAYDTNGDGLLTPDELAVCFCIAGYDASSFADPSRTDMPIMWPHSGTLAKSSRAAAGSSGGSNAGDSSSSASQDQNVAPVPIMYIALSEYFWQDGTPLETAKPEPLGVLYHELGHYLGLPDLYALNGNPENEAWGAFRVGMLSIMDSGGWAEARDASGNTWPDPMAFDAWSRYVLGWEHPKVVTSTGDYEVTSQLSESGYQTLLIPTADPDEFFIVENRQPEGIDEAIGNEFANGNTAGGIVVWHVDKGAYVQYNAANTVNNTQHHPAIMEECFELAFDGSGYTPLLAEGSPNTYEPFYDSASCAVNLGDAQATVSLPLYNDDPEADVPDARIDSGIVLQFPTESAREMTVHVELPSAAAVTSSRAYPLEELDGYRNTAGNPTVADVACTAILHETSAQIAFISESEIANGIPEGQLTWDNVYSVLPSDSTIALYSLTGSQLLELLNQAATASLHDGQTEADAIFFCGATCIIDANSADGSRVSNVSVDSLSLSPIGTYTVAVTADVIERCPLLASLNRDNLTLWGSPADALRSLVCSSDWEETVAQHASDITFVEKIKLEPVDESADAGRQGLPIAIIVISLVVVALGAFALLRFRRGQ